MCICALWAGGAPTANCSDWVLVLAGHGSYGSDWVLVLAGHGSNRDSLSTRAKYRVLFLFCNEVFLASLGAVIEIVFSFLEIIIIILDGEQSAILKVLDNTIKSYACQLCFLLLLRKSPQGN